MPEILAHRGNLAGPARATENTVPALAACLARGWGLEIDIRRAPDGRFYISHDAQDSAGAPTADAFCDVLRRYPHATVALNIKELGDEAALVAYLRGQQVLPQVFLFDMELIEPVPGGTARLLHGLEPAVRLAARVSDRREPVERALAIDCTTVIWLDEFERQWASSRDVRRLKNQGRTVYAVSPDLHGYPFDVARRRWEDFLGWGVDGICTDYPAALAHTITRLQAVPA